MASSPALHTRSRQRVAEGSVEQPQPTSMQPSRISASLKPSRPSQAAGSKERDIAKAVVSCIGTLWIVAVIVGLILHTDLPYGHLRGVKRRLPMVWFDRVLRRYGAIMPLPGFLARWWGCALAKPGRNVRPASHFAESGCIYVGLTVARFLVYFLHLTGFLHLIGKPFIWTSSGEDKHGHLMSDHLVLGASITAILTTEVVLALGDLRRALSRKRDSEPFQLVCLFTALALSAALCLGTIIDMFFTARYFHGRVETFFAVILGSLLFQGPLIYWLLYGFEPHHVAAPRA